MLRSLVARLSNIAPSWHLQQTVRLASTGRALKVIGQGAGRWTAAQGLFLGNSKAFTGSLARFATGSAMLLPASFQFQEMGLLGWFLVDLAINVGGWAVAAVGKTEKFFDALGSLSFITLTAGSFLLPGPSTPRKILVSCMVGVWAVRLGSYLVHRIHKSGKDSRFDDIKTKPFTFLFYWVMQAVWVWVTLSPVLIVNGMKATTPLGWVDILGASVFALGFGFEAIADYQKDVFRSNPENKGKFITEGLWSVSRHPNYFGEAMLWWGVFITCSRSFTAGPQFASVAGPLFVYLLVRFGSGVPILERQADERWGHLGEYQKYKASTPIFFPLPWTGNNAHAEYTPLPSEPAAGEADKPSDTDKDS